MVTSAKIVVLVKSNIGEGAKLDNILVTKWDNANCLFRANHGCAVIKDSKGRKGILVVGGTGDKVKKNFWSNFPNFQSCVGTSVEFLDLDIPGAKWEKMPKLRESRCCSPMVGRVFLFFSLESSGSHPHF